MIMKGLNQAVALSRNVNDSEDIRETGEMGEYEGHL